MVNGTAKSSEPKCRPQDSNTGPRRQKDEDDVVMRAWKMDVSVHRQIERPQLRWRDAIQKDTKETRVQREEALVRQKNEYLMCQPQIEKKSFLMKPLVSTNTNFVTYT